MEQLHRYWQDWQSKLKTIIEKQSARLIFPSLSGPAEKNGEFHYEIDKPVLIFNAPQKAASRKSKRNAIFIEGGFSFVKRDAGWQLIDARCCVSMFEIDHSNGGMVVTLFDSLHFDMERIEKQRDFHPVFHIQRGKSFKLNKEMISSLLAEVIRNKGLVVDVKDDERGSQYLRLPSPQLDLFSVIVMLMADFFCDPSDGDAKMKVLFADLLKLLCNEKNAARYGLSAQALYHRTTEMGWSSSAHWYKESVA